LTQTRFHFIAAGDDARRAYRELEGTFEDDGLPLAIVELDEKRDLHEISVYAEDDPETVRAKIAEILRHALPSPPPVEREILPDIDWVTKSLEGLQPIRSRRFLVHGSHDRARKRIGDIGIEIDAGQAFGTGHHGTTSGCLDMLWQVARRERPRNALDLGTGSAVLAIALAKIARIPILATDIDPIATKVAAQNVRLNGAEAWVETRCAAGFHDPAFAQRGPFGLILANILARPLMKLAPAMALHLAPGGSLILSGILERQRRAVVAAYATHGFRHVSTLPREGWVTLHMKR
jgi:ribosomal protein L11 methyltransferase